MRACVIHSAKDLRIEERQVPEIGDDEVLVRVRSGGICGSDIHYYRDGQISGFVIREPLIPGHEFAGEVAKVGAKVTRVAPGDRTAVNPGRACGHCPRCLEGRGNLCQNVFFMGSASRTPHMQGGFSEFVAVRESQCFPVKSDISFSEIAFAEPLSVALHAAQRAGNLMGRRVLVSGGGPVGQLVLCAARRGGAAHVTLTDVMDRPLEIARTMGADAAINVADGPENLANAAKAIGGYDVALEVSGVPVALNGAIEAVRPGGIVVLVGSPPAGTSPMLASRVMTKELDLRGSFRFGQEFGDSVNCLAARRIDVRPLISREIPMENAAEAFAVAGDRSRNIKVMVTF